MPNVIRTANEAVETARTSGVTLETISGFLLDSLAKLSVDMSELPRTAASANALGKLTKAYSERTVAYKRAGVVPTHENLPFFIPVGVVPTPAPADNTRD